MTYLFKKNLLSSSKHNIKSPYSMEAQYITVHNTANDASAANEVTYHNRNDEQISYHVAIDDKEVIQCIPFNRNAWHCGDGRNGIGNRKSIGIEICYSKSGGTRYTAAEENAVQYIARLLFEFSWGTERIKQHYDWSKKNCPHRIREEKRWESFITRIQVALEKMKNPSKENVPVEAKEALLTATGRNEIRSLLKKARVKKYIPVGQVKEAFIIDPEIHTDSKINNYSDVELLSYQAAIINRSFR